MALEKSRGVRMGMDWNVFRTSRSLSPITMQSAPAPAPERTPMPSLALCFPSRLGGTSASRCSFAPTCLRAARTGRPEGGLQVRGGVFAHISREIKRKGGTTGMTCRCGGPAEHRSAPMRMLCNLLHCVYKFFTRKRRRKCLTVSFVDFYHLLNDLT